MSDIAANLTQLVGKTPLLDLSRYCTETGAGAKIIAKLEYFNPLGSAKDRVGLAMIEAAEKQGLLKKSSVIIEPTSGNTGIGLAFACSIKGYRLILTMPESMSEERKKLLSALGAELVLTPASEGMAGAIAKSGQLAETIPDSYIPDQFSNPANPQIHRITTGPELLRGTNGKINYFVAGVGTGGTITGVGEVLKAFNKHIKIIAAEPADSPVLSGGQAGPHKLMGIGAGFVPANLNREIIDEVITVTTEQAYECARLVAKKEGLLIGISSGAALYAATQIAKRPEAAGKTVAVLFTDSGERYLSTDLFKA
ncbi:MAG: cysteine synthase A [Clostridiales bacterium]|nr:cysteine synthase A [Clostridiales bacterium]